MLGARSFSEAYGRLKSAYYRKWGAAIARANAGLRRARLEFVGARGNRVREYAEDDGCGVAARRVRSTRSWPTWVGEWVVGLAAPPPERAAAAAVMGCGCGRVRGGRPVSRSVSQ